MIHDQRSFWLATKGSFRWGGGSKAEAAGSGPAAAEGCGRAEVDAFEIAAGVDDSRGRDTGSNSQEKACEKLPPETQALTPWRKPESMRPSVKPAPHLRVEWLPTMPWNECPGSRGIGTQLPWNAHVSVPSSPATADPL